MERNSFGLQLLKYHYAMHLNPAFDLYPSCELCVVIRNIFVLSAIFIHYITYRYAATHVYAWYILACVLAELHNMCYSIEASKP